MPCSRPPVAGWLHQLTATTTGEDIIAGHGVRDGKAIIATLAYRLIRVPARPIRHTGTPGHRRTQRTPFPRKSRSTDI